MNPNEYIASNWLAGAFLKARALTTPDSRPLYAYRCSNEEFVRAARILRTALKDRDQRGRSVSGLFCLYAAEWWRRNYQGGAWAWQPIFAEIGIAYDWNIATQLTDKGLAHWGRTLRMRGSNREFLLSIILEAGIPLYVARSSHGALTAVLKRVLADLDKYGASEENALRFATVHGGSLPSSFRNGEMFALIAQLMLTTLQCRDQLPGDVQAANAVAWLDANRPGWRDHFPLSLDDTAAQGLLAGLIKDSVAVKERGRQLGSLVERVLQRDGTEWQFAVTFLTDGVLPSGSIESLDQVKDSGALRARLFPSGKLERSLNGPIALASLETDDGIARWRLKPLGGAKNPVALDHSEEVRLRVVSGIDDLAAFVPPGGEPLPRAPWVFESYLGEDQGEPRSLRFLGGGSLRSRRQDLFIACREQENLQAGDGAAIEPVGAIANSPYQLFRITGSVLYSTTTEGPHIRVSTVSDVDRIERIVPRGKVPRWRTQDLAFLGAPAFWETLDGAISRQAKPANLLWRPAEARRAPWQPVGPNGLPHGALEVALVRANELIDRVRIVVLPKSMAITLRPTDGRRGRIEIRGSDETEVLVERFADKATITELPVDDGIDVTLESTGEAPAEVTIEMRWPEDRGSLRNRVPFPTRGGGFVGPKGRWLKANAKLTLDALYGVRAVAPPNMATATLYARLQAKDVKGHGLSFRRVFTTECSLNSQRQVFLRLLAASRDLDAALILTVEHDGSASAPVRLSRLDLGLAIDAEGVEIAADSSAPLDAEAIASVEILARPLDDFGQEPILLPRLTGFMPDRWGLEPIRSCPGSWLFYGRVEGRYRFRPKMGIIPGDLPEGKTPPDTEIIACSGIADYRMRRLALIERLTALSRLPDAKDWRMLDQALVALTGTLPLVTLDYFPLLAGLPESLAMFLVRSNGEAGDAILGMEDELPFCWVTLPLKDWFSAFTIYKQSQEKLLSEAGLDGALAAVIVERVLNKLPEADPALAATAILIRSHLKQSTTADQNSLALRNPALRPFAESLIAEARMRCRQRNSNAEWPETSDFRQPGVPLPADHLGHPDFCRPALDAPFAAASTAAVGTPATPEFVRSIRLCREFDPVWFEEAYPVALMLADAVQRP